MASVTESIIVVKYRIRSHNYYFIPIMAAMRGILVNEKYAAISMASVTESIITGKSGIRTHSN